MMEKREREKKMVEMWWVEEYKCRC